MERQSKFKVGDRVRRVAQIVDSSPIGDVVEVVEPAREITIVDNAIWYINKHGYKVWSSAENWELVHPEGPVRTVTRKEIVPGRYGSIDVLAGLSNAAIVRLVPSDGHHMFPAELRDAARVFNELADALEVV